MTARAIIRERWELGGIDVIVVHQESPRGVRVRQWVGGALDYRLDDPETATEAPTTDRLPLTDDEARALYEALAEHYGHGTNDVRALRRDHDAERDRVDKLTDAVIAIARRKTGGA